MSRPTPSGPCSPNRFQGFGELFRWLSYAEIGTSTIQSRADAGVCGDTIVFLLPGSTGACLLGMEKIILPQLDLNHQPCNLVELLPRIKQEHPPGEGAECSLDHVPLPAGPGEPVRSAKDAEYDQWAGVTAGSTPSRQGGHDEEIRSFGHALEEATG
jgi:hypothetical protein